jgi:hypothetical protein
MLLLGAVSASAQQDPDDPGIADTMALVLVAGDQPDANGTKYTFKLELWVYNDSLLKGANGGWSWANSTDPSLLTLDSAVAPSYIDTWWDLTYSFYEASTVDPATSNANDRFLAAFARLFQGAPGDATGRRLWGTYYFSVDPSWSTSDVIQIDTLKFNQNSTWVFINNANVGYQPIWPAGDGQPIYIADVSDIERTDGILPETFSLSQNYPNPFNPTTKIQFSVPSREWVRLDIFNILGQKVNTIVDAPLDAGNYVEEWDGSDESGASVASGIYFYKLTAGSFVDTKKMMLLK